MFLHLPTDIINCILSYLFSYEQLNVKWTCKTLLKEIVIAKSVFANEIKPYEFPQNTFGWQFPMDSRAPINATTKVHTLSGLCTHTLMYVDEKFSCIFCVMDCELKQGKYDIYVFSERDCEILLDFRCGDRCVFVVDFDCFKFDKFIGYGYITLDTNITQIQIGVRNTNATVQTMIIPSKYAETINSILSPIVIYRCKYVEKYIDTNKWILMMKNVYSVGQLMNSRDVQYYCNKIKSYVKIDIRWFSETYEFQLCNVFFENDVYNFRCNEHCDYFGFFRDRCGSTMDKMNAVLTILYFICHIANTNHPHNYIFSKYSPYNPCNMFIDKRTNNFKFIVDFIKQQLTVDEIIQKINEEMCNHPPHTQLVIRESIRQILAFSTQ